MKYTIHNIRYETEDLDDDLIVFRYEIHFTEPDTFIVSHYGLHFFEITSFIKQKYSSFYDYFENTRSSIDGFGPCEKRTVDAIGEEAVKQLFGIVKEYLLTSEMIPKSYDFLKKLNANRNSELTPEGEQFQKKFAALTQLAKAANTSTNRTRKFCEEVTKAIRKTAMDIYPEIAEYDSELLLKFKYLFVDDVLSMKEKIDKFTYHKK